MTGMDCNTSSLSVLEPELYFLIARFLNNGPCKRAAKALLEELEEFQLLPQRVDWEGNTHFRSYEHLVYLNRHIKGDHLLRIVERLGTLLDKEIKPSVPGVKSLLGAGSLSLLRTAEGIRQTKWSSSHHIVRQHGMPIYPPANLAIPAVPHVAKAYQMSGVVRHHSIAPTSLFNKISMHGRKLGHLSAVYCVLFDRTGNYIFTGADDALVKIWSVYDMRLLATLRGHSAEITDMAVSYENTYLASGSCDKVVRIWCLRSKAPAAVLQAHSSMITSVQFCPKAQGDNRYIVSTGNDGCVCFWHYNIHTNVFSLKPIKFIEKSRAGAQMLCSSFSPGGAFLATGNSDHVVRVYFLHAVGIEKICELEAHTDKVDSICYSNNLNRFVSGSNDGTARIWRFEKQEWRATVLNMNAKINSPSQCQETNRNDAKDQLRVTMVSWSMDDQMVLTAVSDFTIKIWNAYTGTLLKVLEGHEDEVFVLEACPTDARILLSAGHDGRMIIWDLYSGAKIKKFFNLIEGQGHGAVFDCKFSPDGHSLAATDSHGHLLLLGFGTNERCKKIPQQMFFHTDYRPLMRDANNFVLDEQTQQPPHLMPPPFLVDIDGNPYPAALQRLVPGREHCKESNLVPQMVVNAHGESEVIGDLDNDVRQDGAANQVDDSETEEEADSVDVRPGAVRRGGARPSIDVMIQELQRQQDQRLHRESGSSNSNVMSPPYLPYSPPTPRSHMQNRIGMRRSGEIEGVRQSLGNVSVRSTKKERDAARRHVTVRPLDPEMLRASEEKRSAYTEEEIRKFVTERKKKLLSPHDLSSASVLVNKKRGQKPKKQTSGDGQRMEDIPENMETARNRLTTRALYDTEEEEDEEGGSDVDLWDSDNSSSDYSDWVGDQGSSNLEPPKRRSQRKPKRRRLSSTDEDDLIDVVEADEEEMDTEDTTTSDDSSSEEEKENIEGPSTSTKRESKRRKASQKTFRKKRKKAERRRKPRLVPPDPNLKPVTELDEKMKPPEWITSVIPRKAPFVPQMGDEVMYFRQGHEQYLQAVLRKEVYKVDVDKNQPWHKIPNLRAHESVKIVGIKWLMKPTRLCCLKLAFMDPNSGRLTGKSFTIKYHDMPDVIDFLVLKQHYDISVERGWKPGMRFRSMIDDQWWMGAIKSQEPLYPEFPDCLYQCFNVQWDNGEFEKLSPWDMEPIDPKRKPAVVGGGVGVTQEEYKSLLYVPKKTEWPSCGREADSQRLIRGLEALMQHSVAEPFIAPVDLQQFPTYACFVSYPIDLSTIKTRLENGFYRRVTALQWDVRLISANASIFNKSGSSIVKNANALSETLLRFIKDHGCQDPLTILSELAHSDFKTGSSDDESQPGNSKTHSSPRKKKRKRKPNPEAWLEQSESLLAMLFDCEDSEPFRIPVNPADYPDYEDIVTNPMDLTTVHTKLATGHYGNPVDMCRDIRLIFQNSKLYNINKRSRIYSMTLRLSALFEAQITEIINTWKSALKASGRIRKQPRSKHSSSPQPSASWDTLTSNILDPNQPSTSGYSNGRQTINGAGPSIHSNGHIAGSSSKSKKNCILTNGDDSDATIVDDDKKSEDVDTEFCDEDAVNGIVNHTDHDSDDDMGDDDDRDNDYRPSQYVKNFSKAPPRGKPSKRGKGKSTRPLPPRLASERLKKSNIFYTSDGNSDEDFLSDDEDEGNEKLTKRGSKSKVNHVSRVVSDDSDSDTPVQPAPRGRGRPPKSATLKKKNSVKTKSTSKKLTSDNEETPIHRKVRSTRSRRRMINSEDEEGASALNGSRSRRRRIHSEDDEGTNELNGLEKENASALARSSRSARFQKKDYNEVDSDAADETDNSPDNSETEEEEVKDHTESEEESTEEDSDDEIMNASLKSSTQKSSKNKSANGVLKRSKNFEDSDSDAVVPHKRKRLRSSSPVKVTKKMHPVKTKFPKKNESRKVRSKDSSGRQTRNRGQQKVTYLEDYGTDDDAGDNNTDDDSENDSESENDTMAYSRSVSSRGRVRKLTARAKASLKGH
ncbi:bromodomain and WD repeat-containing protein 3-like [Physella acuta]|uniref:bromodomain and WD repeat-containing protein 3-like n=1 Tax=Physella acuta TaxID=109671 RepID=UPI0027DBF238|nr:bromodomain and WD repeat-containing protein 3-like [Physella acuta]